MAAICTHMWILIRLVIYQRKVEFRKSITKILQQYIKNKNFKTFILKNNRLSSIRVSFPSSYKYIYLALPILDKCRYHFYWHPFIKFIKCCFKKTLTIWWQKNKKFKKNNVKTSVSEVLLTFKTKEFLYKYLQGRDKNF